MGFRYRKSINLGPFRLNVGNHGIGASVGTRGFRTGVSSRGRRHTTFSLPGTGLSYRRSGCLLPVLAMLLAGCCAYFAI